MFTKKNFFTYDLLQESTYFLIIFFTAACELHNSWIYRKPNKKHMYVYTYLYTYISIYFIKQYLDK